MLKLVGFLFDKTAGKALSLFLLAAGLVGWWQLDRAHQRSLGAAHARTETNEQAHELADKARTARDAVDDATALDGLRERYCRNC